MFLIGTTMSASDYYSAYAKNLQDLCIREDESTTAFIERIWTDHAELRKVPIPPRSLSLWTERPLDKQDWLQRIKRVAAKRIKCVTCGH